jgi:hypothetical protein
MDINIKCDGVYDSTRGGWKATITADGWVVYQDDKCLDSELSAREVALTRLLTQLRYLFK